MLIRCKPFLAWVHFVRGLGVEGVSNALKAFPMANLSLDNS